jgi:hypothetical protein
LLNAKYVGLAVASCEAFAMLKLTGLDAPFVPWIVADAFCVVAGQ